LSEFAPEELETIRLIDQRQTQLLEDLDLLNARIVALLEQLSPAREQANETEGEPTVTASESLESAA
jgi:hypothetical protein